MKVRILEFCNITITKFLQLSRTDKRLKRGLLFVHNRYLTGYSFQIYSRIYHRPHATCPTGAVWSSAVFFVSELPLPLTQGSSH